MNKALGFPFGIFTNDNTPLDAKYFKDFNTAVTPKTPYVDVAEANSLLLAGLRHQGLTINIAGAEYWYKDGISDIDLVVKQEIVKQGKIKITDLQGQAFTDLATAIAWITPYYVGDFTNDATDLSFNLGVFKLTVPENSSFAGADGFCSSQSHTQNIQFEDSFVLIIAFGKNCFFGANKNNIFGKIDVAENFLRNANPTIKNTIAQIVSCGADFARNYTGRLDIGKLGIDGAQNLPADFFTTVNFAYINTDYANKFIDSGNPDADLLQAKANMTNPNSVINYEGIDYSGYIYKDADFTAENGMRYIVRGSTITDPTPVAYQGYEVYAFNGTAQIDGIIYPENSLIHRYYTGLIWRTTVINNPTNLSYNSSTGVVSNTNGLGFVIPLADATNPGLLKPAKFTVLENTAGSNNGDDATNSQYSGLATSKEDTANKQTDLTASATKFPTVNAVNTGLALKQATLVSGGNIVTINNQPILGSGNITIAGGVVPNTAITGATKTKITYDSKGLVTAGTDATTADIADSTNKRYITDDKATVLANTTNTNSGNDAPNSNSNAYTDSLIATKANKNNPDLTGKVTLLGSVATLSSDILLDLNQTWNTNTQLPTGIQLNINETLTASDSSLLLNLLVNGVRKFSVNKAGDVYYTGNLLSGGSGELRQNVWRVASANSSVALGFGGSNISGATPKGVLFTNLSNNINNTSDSFDLLSSPLTFNPTSGTGIFNFLNVDTTINQTGGANGKFRGFYFNPTIISATNVVAIEVVTGKVIIPNGVLSNEAVNLSQVPLQLRDFYVDVSNSGLVETDLYTHTTIANRLNTTGQKLIASYAGKFNDPTASSQLRVYFGGILIGDTGALTMSVTGAWIVSVSIMRTGTTTARAIVNISTPGASTASYTNYTSITGLDFTTTNIIKITGQAGGVGGSSGDITASYGNLFWQPAAI